jgi:hypothetical protein
MRITKVSGFILISILVISISVTSIYVFYQQGNKDSKEKFFFGVSYGQNTVEDAKTIINKVRNFTNLFIINSFPITVNNTNPEVLNEICDYAAKSDLYFIVYFFSFYLTVSDWQQEWVDTAKQNWGEKFLGVYLRDEPGGWQMEKPEPTNATTYGEAAENFIKTISTSDSMEFLNNKSIPVFTSDFVLYYYDYLSGYDTVFAEFGWNNSRIRQVGLCRGASKMLNKDWGAIITWTYMRPPYLGSGAEIYEDMTTAYDAGAKYVVMFDYEKENQKGILTEEHFRAMEQFWEYVSSNSKKEKIKAQVAYILPNYYGWGMRHPDDKIWGIWDADEKSSIIWENLNKLETKYGLLLDIIYDDPQYDIKESYYQTFVWNATIN